MTTECRQVSPSAENVPLDSLRTHSATSPHLGFALNWPHLEACRFLVTPALTNSQASSPCVEQQFAGRRLTSIPLFLGGAVSGQGILINVRSINRNSNLSRRHLKHNTPPTVPIFLSAPRSQSPPTWAGTKLEPRRPLCHGPQLTFNQSPHLMILPPSVSLPSSPPPETCLRVLMRHLPLSPRGSPCHL